MVINYSIKPFIRTDKSVKENNKYPIYFSVRIDNKQVKIPAKKEIEGIFWDKKLGRVSKSAPNSITLNNSLAKVEQDFKDFILKNEMNGKAIGLDGVKRYFKGNRSTSFYEFFKEVQRIKKLKPNTIKVYETTYTILKAFKPNLAFYEITPLFIKQFNHYLVSVRGNGNGGLYNRHKILKCVLLEAIKNDIIEKNPYLGFPLRKVAVKKTYLTTHEINKIEHLAIPENKVHLQKIKDMFLFSCFTGIRFSDVLDLEWGNITVDSIDFKMNKTGKFISIPIILGENMFFKFISDEELAAFRNSKIKQAELMVALKELHAAMVNLDEDRKTKQLVKKKKVEPKKKNK